MCWRCGKTSCTKRLCLEKVDVYGNALNSKDGTTRFRYTKMEKKQFMAMNDDADVRICNNCDEELSDRISYRCNECEDAVYCSKDCQINHWSEHQFDCASSSNSKSITPNCKPENSLSGRKRKLDGTLLKKEIKIEDVGTLFCSNCKMSLHHDHAWRCSQCKLVYYCGTKCQINHWDHHKTKCGTPTIVKTEKVGVTDWNYYSVICWLNRVNNGQFKGAKYRELRKHLFIGQIGGSDLGAINEIILRMMGIHDVNEQELVLDTISELLLNDGFDHRPTNAINGMDIPIKYVGALSYEVMTNPIKVVISAYVYEEECITQYIKQHLRDPITEQSVILFDLVECRELKRDIKIWRAKQSSESALLSSKS